MVREAIITSSIKVENFKRTSLKASAEIEDHQPPLVSCED